MIRLLTVLGLLVVGPLTAGEAIPPPRPVVPAAAVGPCDATCKARAAMALQMAARQPSAATADRTRVVFTGELKKKCAEKH